MTVKRKAAKVNTARASTTSQYVSFCTSLLFPFECVRQTYREEVTRWAHRHRTAIALALEQGEQLVDADRVIATQRRRARGTSVPRVGFVLVVTDRRLVALKASRGLARPGRVIADWTYDSGASLASAPLGRVRLVLPDRTVVTLRPYGPRSVAHLATD